MSVAPGPHGLAFAALLACVTSAGEPAQVCRVQREVAGIRGGQPVMIIGEQAATRPLIEPGVCEPLIPISDDEVEGGD